LQADPQNPDIGRRNVPVNGNDVDRSLGGAYLLFTLVVTALAATSAGLALGLSAVRGVACFSFTYVELDGRKPLQRDRLLRQLIAEGNEGDLLDLISSM
jgi:hypothetical protein